MKSRSRIYVVIGVIIVLLGLLLVTLPRDRLLRHEEYTPLEFYPTYYYYNFTVASSDTNAVLSIDLNVDAGGNYTNYLTLWNLYQLLPAQFEEDFNVTEAHDAMTGEDWDIDAFWAGGINGDYIFPHGEPIPSGAYVFVFWIEPDGPTADWSATLAISLRTSLLPMA